MKTIIYIMMLVLVASFALGVPPVLQTFSGLSGFDIAYPQYEVVKSGESFSLHTHVYNLSDGTRVSNNTAECGIDIYNSTGDEVLTMDMNRSHDYEFVLFIDKGNFSKVGFYSFIITCNSTEAGGFVSGNFQVTKSGTIDEYNDSSMGLGIVIFILLFTIPFFMFGWSKDPLSTHELANFIFKKLLLFIGSVLLLFDTTIILTLSENAHLGISSELFFVMRLIQMTFYPFLAYIMFTTLTGGLKLWKWKKENKRMGYE